MPVIYNPRFQIRRCTVQIDFYSWHNKGQCELFKINPIQSSFQFSLVSSLLKKSWRRLQRNSASSSKRSSRRLQKIVNTSLQNIFKRRLQDVFAGRLPKTCNWLLNLKSEEEIMLDFSGINQMKYVRIWPLYINDMYDLQHRAADLWAVFMRGDLICQKSDILRTVIGPGHANEQRNKIIKTVAVLQV